MNEWREVLIIPLKFFTLFLFVMSYAVGGRTAKYIRRWAGGTLLSLGCIWVAVGRGSFGAEDLSVFAIYLGLVLGYGGNTFEQKFIRRFIYGSVLGSVGLFVGLLNGVLMLGFAQLFLAIIASIFFGVFNPSKSAVDEESCIALLSVCLIPFMV